MKRVLKNLLICILIIVISSNFVLDKFRYVYATTPPEPTTPGGEQTENQTGEDGDEDFEEFGVGGAIAGVMSNIVTGFVGLILWIPHIILFAPIMGISTLILGIAKLGLVTGTDGHLIDAVVITPYDVLFNKIPLVNINFFNFNVGDPVKTFREQVAGWYYTMRLIATMVLLVILIYIGIRMALTSIASEKAMYKKMLVDWATSLALLFLLHYIILFVFACNDALVSAMETIGTQDPNLKNSTQYMMTYLSVKAFDVDLIIRLAAAIIYGMIVIQTISFLFAYIKRMFTIGFLIIIAPLITITYSIDKIGDGKAQALNTWLKEFIYNILIQPFQCILYLAFANLAFNTLIKEFSISNTINGFTTSQISKAIFAILCLQFIKEGEKIIKKIFGFEKASVAGDIASGMVTAGAIMKGGAVAKKVGGSVAKLSNKVKSSNAAQNLKARRNEKKQNKLNKNVKALASKTGKSEEEAKKLLSNKGRFTSTKRFVNSEKLQKKASERATQKAEKTSKKEKKLNDQAEINAQKRWEKDGKTGNASKEYIEEEKNKLKQQQKPKRDIKGFAKNVGNTISNSPVTSAVKGLYNYGMENRKALKGMTFGLMAAGMGLATGDFGDFTGAVAGFNMGKGLVDGYYENSSKSIREELDSALQMASNLRDDGDSERRLSAAFIRNLNDISKDIKDAIKKLEKSLDNNPNKQAMIGEFSNIALGENAGSLTEQSIMKMLDDNGLQDNPKKDEIFKNFKEYGALLGEQRLANGINNAAAMGIDREALAKMLGNREVLGRLGETGTGNSPEITYSPVTEDSPVTGDSPGKTETNSTTEETITETEVYEERYKDLDLTELSRIIGSNLSNGSNSTTLNDNTQIQNKINELNSLIGVINNKNSDDLRTITANVSTSNTNIASQQDIVNSFKSQIRDLEDIIKRQDQG